MARFHSLQVTEFIPSNFIKDAFLTACNKEEYDFEQGIFLASSLGDLEIIKFMIEKGAKDWNLSMRSACKEYRKLAMQMIREKQAS